MSYEMITVLVHLVTLSVTCLSAYNVYRQQTTTYQHVKDLLIVVHLLYCVIIVFELLRPLYSTIPFMAAYTIMNTSFVLWDVMLLTLVAVVIYRGSSGSSHRHMLSEAFISGINGIALTSFSIYIVVTDLYLMYSRPFDVEWVPDILGTTVAITVFDNNYLSMLAIVLILFITYPATLLILSARKSSDPAARKALVILPVAWAGIGIELLIFNGYLLTVGVDATAIGYLIAAAAFSLSAAAFHRGTVLSGFFELRGFPAYEPSIYPFSKRLGGGRSLLSGKIFLLEVDPNTNYEEIVRDFASEVISNKHAMFVFSSKGNPVYQTLSNGQNLAGEIRFYTLTDNVSYPKPSDQAYEVLVPRHDQPILLDVIDKTVKSTHQTGVAFLIDSISDLILSLGFLKCYEFIKKANEIISDHGAVSLFLMTQSAHDEKTTALVKSLFVNYLSFDPSGLKIVKQARLTH